MNVFNVDKLEIVANKINYLIQKIKNDPSESKKLEVKLLKKYTQDFYDLLIENDFANYNPETEPSGTGPLDSQKALIQSFLHNSGVPEVSEPHGHPILASLFSSPDKVEKIEIDLKSEPEPQAVSQASLSPVAPDDSVPEVLPLPSATIEMVQTPEVLPSTQPENLIQPYEPVLKAENFIPEEPVISLSPELKEMLAKYEEEVKPINETDLSTFNKLFGEKTESLSIEDSSPQAEEPILRAEVEVSEEKTLHQQILDGLETRRKQMELDAKNISSTPTSLPDTPVSPPQEQTEILPSAGSLESVAPNDLLAKDPEPVNLPNTENEDINKTMVIPVHTIQDINATAEEVQSPPTLAEEILSKLEERRKALETLQATIKHNESAKPEETKKDIFISFEKIEGDAGLPQDVERDINKTEVINISPFSDLERKLIAEEAATVDEENKVPQKLSLNDILAQKKEDTALADVLARGNNEGAFDISFNQRFAYINELFGGSHSTYEETLRNLAACSTVIEAFTYLNLNVRNKFNWQDNDPTTKEFLATVRKKFQTNYA